MAKWNHKFKIKEEWQKCEKDEISIHDLVRAIIIKLQLLQKKPEFQEDFELEEIIDIFVAEVKQEEYTKDDFDVTWEMFYDWADSNRVWVETF